MTRRRVWPWLISGLFAAWSGTAVGNPCDNAIVAVADGPVPYGPRAGGRYCEGSYARPVRASFEVLSVTAGPISFGQNDTQIIVSAPLSSAGGALSIRARGRAIGYGYQMDAELTPPSAFTWPTATLRTMQLRRNDFGLFGYRTNGTSLVYVPIAARRTAAASAGEPILIELIAPEHLAGPVEYVVARTGNAIPPVWNRLRETGVNKGEVLIIRLPADALAAPVTLRVRAPARSTPLRSVRLTMDLAR